MEQQILDPCEYTSSKAWCPRPIFKIECDNWNTTNIELILDKRNIIGSIKTALYQGCGDATAVG